VKFAKNNYSLTKMHGFLLLSIRDLPDLPLISVPFTEQRPLARVRLSCADEMS